MKIGDLFLEVNLKGIGKAVSGLNGIKKSLSGITSEALGAFGQITALVGAFGTLATVNGNAAMKLQQYSNITGASTKNLQDWQYTLSKAGVPIDETTNAMVHLQDIFSEFSLLTKGLPSGFGGLLQKYGRGLTESSFLNAGSVEARIALLQKLASQIRGEADKSDFRNRLQAAFGFSNVFTQGLETSGPLQHNPYARSAKQIEALAKIRAQITQLQMALERSFDNFLLKNFKDISTAVFGLIRILPEFLSGLHPVIRASAAFATSLFQWAKAHPDMVKNIGEITAAVTGLAIAFKLLAAAIGLANLALSPEFAVIAAGGAIGYGLTKADKGIGNAMDSLVDSLFTKLGINHALGAGGPGTPSNVSAIVNQNFYGPTEPSQVGKAAKSGTQDGLHKALKNSYNSNPDKNVHS